MTTNGIVDSATSASAPVAAVPARRRLRLGFCVLAVAVLLAIGGGWTVWSQRPNEKQQPVSQPAAAQAEPSGFTYLTESTYSRGGLIGVVLRNRFGLGNADLARLPADFTREQFYAWLREADKILETISLLRVPNLRSDRPTLDGRDLYDGFFAPKPAFWDVAAPLEGSLSVLRKQGFTFTAEEQKALDAMLKATMGKQASPQYRWHVFPVGSKILLQAGRAPAVTIWVNRGQQYPDLEATVKRAQGECVVQIAITDPMQVQALNKHFNYALEAKDEQLEQNSKGKYRIPREALFDVVREFKKRPPKPDDK